ncbi:DUF6600 domain-containing protein [Thiomonas sp.]
MNLLPHLVRRRGCLRWGLHRALPSLFAVAIVGLAPLAHAGEPPALVGRIAEFQGEVSLLPAGASSWIAASLNRPITIGDRLWVPPGGRADIVAGPDAIRLGPGTDLTVLDLREQDVQLSLSQGTAQLQVRAFGPDQRVEVDTPNLAFQLQSAGDMRLDVNPAADTTTATLRAGQGAAYGESAAPYAVEAGQRARFAGQNLTVVAAEDNPPADAFDQWVAQLNAREDASISARYVSPWVTGYQGLDAWGEWAQSPQYGPVWYPRVAPGWVPYRNGHWAWVPPWGWTWIAAEPWGFAPFHYGRWAWVGSAWAWVPGPVVVRPVYAPALVAFVGAAPGVTFSFGVAGGAPAVGWFPLGPGQIYRPPYAYTPAYLVEVNRCTPISDRDHDWINVRRELDPRRLPPHALTLVPRTAFVQGLPVQDHVHRLAALPAHILPLATAPDAHPLAASVTAGARPMPWPTGFRPRPVLATREPGPLPQRSGMPEADGLRPPGTYRVLPANNTSPERVPVRIVPVPVQRPFPRQPVTPPSMRLGQLPAAEPSPRPQPGLQPQPGESGRSESPRVFIPQPRSPLAAQPQAPRPPLQTLEPAQRDRGFSRPMPHFPEHPAQRFDQRHEPRLEQPGFAPPPGPRPSGFPAPERGAGPPSPIERPGEAPQRLERPAPELRQHVQPEFQPHFRALAPGFEPSSRGEAGRSGRPEGVPERGSERRAPPPGAPQGVPGPLQRAGMAPP